jgi:hypothetical protein
VAVSSTSSSRRRAVWIVCIALIVSGIAIAALFAMTQRPHRESIDNASTVPAVRTPAVTPTPSQHPPPTAALPVTDDPVAYSRAVAEHLFDVNPAAFSRQQFLTFWEQNLPTVVYSDAAAKGLTLPDQNADAIDNLTHGWILTDTGWRAEAANATVSTLRITSITVPDYWINAVASGQFVDPGLHMERVMAVLTQRYGVSQRFTSRRAVVIDLGLLCGPTQPGGCRLLAPQTPPGQGSTP